MKNIINRALAANKKLFTLLCAIAIGHTAFANTVTVGGDDDTNLYSTYLPIAINTGTLANCAYYSVSQQLYFSGELAGASSNTITAITFYYHSGTSFTRKLRVWMNNTALTAFSTESTTPNFSNPGTKVFSGDVTLTSGSSYTITFDTPYEWNGSSNIIVTVFDSTGVKNNSTNYNDAAQGQTEMFRTENVARFLHKTSPTYSDFAQAGWTMNNLASASANSSNDRGYVNRITFTFAAASLPDTPDDLAVSATTQTTATLGWTAISGATSYDLQYSTDNENWSNLVTSHTSTSYEMTGLTANTTYYVKIRANNATGSSDYSDAVSFTTDAVHSHNGITFTKWNSTTSLPTSGNYYLAADVTPSGVSGTEISGTLNLCLNGHSVTYTGAAKGISVTSTGSLSIYDNVGGGLITSEHGTATIQVASGGSLALHAGNITNTGEGTPLTFNGTVSLDLTEAASNASYLGLANGQSVDVNLDRSFTSASYNTICLPFALANSQLQSIFGSTYDLEEFDSSNLDGEELVLTFNKVTYLTAGKPYLIQPAANVANPSFAGVTISTTSPVDQTSDTYISFHGVFNPTELEGGNKNLLFLGAANELFYPATTDYLNGFRAYFEVKGTAQKVAKRARIANGTNTATGISDVQRSEVQCTKILRDGQIVIIRQGAEYNAQGIRTK